MSDINISLDGAEAGANFSGMPVMHVKFTVQVRPTKPFEVVVTVSRHEVHDEDIVTVARSMLHETLAKATEATATYALDDARVAAVQEKARSEDR